VPQNCQNGKERKLKRSKNDVQQSSTPFEMKTQRKPLYVITVFTKPLPEKLSNSKEL